MNAIKFGTGGFRGVIGEDFTRETTCGIAEALSQIIEEEEQDPDEGEQCGKHRYTIRPFLPENPKHQNDING